MRVLSLEHTPDCLRGEITRYMQEIKPNLFIGNINRRIADTVWGMIRKYQDVSSVFVEPSDNEQGYSVRMYGYPGYYPGEIDGITVFYRKISKQQFFLQNILAKPNKTLLEHSIEAAVLANELCSHGVFSPIVNTVAGKTGTDVKDIIRFVTLIAAVHDIGKIHPVFQAKITSGRESSYSAFLNEEKLITGTCLNTPFRHEIYGKEVLNNILNGRPRAFSVLKNCVRCHHIKNDSISESGMCGVGKQEAAVWKQAQMDFFNTMVTLFFPSLSEFSNNFCLNIKIANKEIQYFDMVCYVLLGILNCVDFLASGDCVYPAESGDFSPKNSFSIENHIKKCRETAEEFLKNNGLWCNSDSRKTPGFHDLFPFIQNCTKTQETMKQIMSPGNEYGINPDEIALVIIEDACGSGKTESGLFAASELSKDLAGIYFGMPTHATSVAMLSRYEDFCEKVGQEFLPGLYTSKAKLYDRADVPDKKQMDGRLNNSYFKMLFPYAIGSVDQAMSSVRRKVYQVSRLAGMLTKVLLVDEVHSYDPYMVRILGVLLRYRFMFEVPTVLMSATIPVKTKTELVSSMLREIRNTPEEKENPVKLSKGYPMITIVTKSGEIREIEIPAEKETKGTKTVHYDFLPVIQRNAGQSRRENEAASCEEIAEILVNDAQKGGCICCIVNLVSEASAIFDEVIKKQANGRISNTEVILYHSDFFEDDKNRKTEEIVKKFGKDRKNRPESAIVISTQIMEQSIDVDFDFLYTELSPIDSLIQRSGRLWRHNNEGTIRGKQDPGNRDTRLDCPMHILVPADNSIKELQREKKENENVKESVGTNTLFGKSETYIYKGTILHETYRKLYQFREKSGIEGRGVFTAPGDIPELVNDVYDNAEIVSNQDNANSGMLSISFGEECSFNGDQFTRNERETATRDSEFEKEDVVFCTGEEYEELKDGWGYNLCCSLLKTSSIGIAEYKLKKLLEGEKREYGEKLLENHVIIICEKNYSEETGNSLSFENQNGNVYYDNTHGLKVLSSGE